MAYNRQDIIDNLTDEFVLNMMEEFGASGGEKRTTPSGGYCYTFETICHGGDSQKLYYYPNHDNDREPSFHCYTNCGQMSIFDLVSKVRGGDYYSSLNYLGRRLGLVDPMCVVGVFGTPVSTVPMEEEKIVEPKKRSVLDYEVEKLKVYTADYIIERTTECTAKGQILLWEYEGISRKTLLKYEIGFYEKIPGAYYEVHAMYYTIPVRDIDGDLIGIRARRLPDLIDGEWIDPPNKYKPFGIYGPEYKFPTSKALYGLYQNQNAIRKAGYCVIFEGEKSVLKMDTYYGQYPCVAVFGSSISYTHLRMLYDLGVRTVILAFDNDHPEDQEQQERISRFYRDDVIEKLPEFRCDYMFDGYKELLDKKDSPADKGKEVFEELFKRRTKSTKPDVVENS